MKPGLKKSVFIDENTKKEILSMKKTVFSRILLSLMLVLLTVVLLASCGRGDNYVGGDMENSMDKGYTEDNLIVGGTGTDYAFATDRKIIKTVYETVETESYSEFTIALREKVAELGGYFEASNQYGSELSRKRAYYVIRIPAERLDELTADIDNNATVLIYSDTIDDVTGKYIDVESKISVLEAEEAALLEMLKESLSIEQMLLIRSNLTSVQSELASLRNQKKSYDSKIAYSTVNLTVQEVVKETNPDKSFGDDLKDSFREGTENFAEGFRNFFLWLVGNLFSIILTLSLLVGAIFLVRFIIKKKRKG